MNFQDYQYESGRTAGQHDDITLEIANYAMGLAGEAGELVDALKKQIFHGRPATRAHLVSEIGDVLWYLSNIATALNISLEGAAIGNIAKLKKRYPAGFVKGGGIRDVQVAVSPEVVDEVIKNNDEALRKLGASAIFPAQQESTVKLLEEMRKKGTAPEAFLQEENDTLRKRLDTVRAVVDTFKGQNPYSGSVWLGGTSLLLLRKVAGRNANTGEPREAE